MIAMRVGVQVTRGNALCHQVVLGPVGAPCGQGIVVIFATGILAYVGIAIEHEAGVRLHSEIALEVAGHGLESLLLARQQSTIGGLLGGLADDKVDAAERQAARSHVDRSAAGSSAAASVIHSYGSGSCALCVRCIQLD